MITSKVIFDSKVSVPDDVILKEVLGIVHSAYDELLSLTKDYQSEWKFYGPRIGWQFKVSHRGKALFYLTPLEKSFRLGFAVREKEREALAKSKLPAKAIEELSTARKYPEGYPLHLQVRKQSDMKSVRLVIATLKSLRP